MKLFSQRSSTTSTSKPWRPPPDVNLSPTNTTITTPDVTTTRHGVGAIDFASTFGTATARQGPLQVNARWLGPTIHLRPKEQGQWRPTKTTKTTQQSIGMRAGYAGAEKV